MAYDGRGHHSRSSELPIHLIIATLQNIAGSGLTCDLSSWLFSSLGLWGLQCFVKTPGKFSLHVPFSCALRMADWPQSPRTDTGGV